MKLIKFVLLLAFLVVGAAFAIINDTPVMVDLYMYSVELPLSLMLLLAVGVGIVLGAFAGAFYFMRIKKENADLRRKSKLVREEVNNLRAMPLKGR